MHQILIRPLITEKMSNLTADHNKYGFLVIPKANKIEIAKAVENKFNVHVVDIRTVNHPGKTKTQFRKSVYLKKFRADTGKDKWVLKN
jgi:large subunit ribosomal protein L23